MSYFMGNGRADTCRNSDKYEGKAVTITSIELEKRGDFILCEVTDSTGREAKYRLYWDGECISTVKTEKEGRRLLNDFAPKRGKKVA